MYVLSWFQNVGEKQVSCETDLAKAEPALIAAQEALNTLNKVGLHSIRHFTLRVNPTRDNTHSFYFFCRCWLILLSVLSMRIEILTKYELTNL